MFEHVAMLDFGDCPRVRTRFIAVDRRQRHLTTVDVRYVP